MTRRRLDDLFVETGAFGPRKARILAIRPEAARFALQSALEGEPPMPLPETSEGESFGLLLARRTLTVTLPRAPSDKRAVLLEAAAHQLELATESEGAPPLRNLVQLRDRLVLVIAVTDWLAGRARSAAISGLKGEREVVTTRLAQSLEDILSSERRAARDKVSTRRPQVVRRLLDLPQIAAKTATAFATEDGPLSHPDWCASLIAAAWTLPTLPLWSHVSGDLAAIAEIARAADLAPLTPGRFDSDFGLEDLMQRAVEVIGAQELTFSPMSQRVRTVRFGRRDPGAEDELPLALDPYAADELPLRISVSGTHAPFEAAGVGLAHVKSLDLDLEKGLLLGVSYLGADSAETRWVPHSDLKLVGGRVRFAPLLRLPGTGERPGNTQAPRARPLASGTVVWEGGGALQIRFDPGSAIDLIEVNNGELSGGAPLASVDQKLGEVWWLELDASTGRPTQAYVLYSEGGPLVPLPLDDMEYSIEHRSFLYRGGGRLLRNPKQGLVGTERRPKPQRRTRLN